MKNNYFLKAWKKIYKKYYKHKPRYFYINGGRSMGKTYFQEMENEENGKRT